jgi:TonB family protein
MPREAIYKGIEGTVDVVITIDAESGSVNNVQVLQSPHEILSTVVVSALSQWQFAPRVPDDKSSQYTARQSFIFSAR